MPNQAVVKIAVDELWLQPSRIASLKRVSAYMNQRSVTGLEG